MRLRSLLGPEITAPPGSADTNIAGITADSRQVQAGWLFVAISGAKADGARFVPDAVTLHRTLAELAAEGVTHLSFEASSHGLDQHRLDGVRLKAAAFTNLGRDHLDYHPSMEAYLAAKLRLFTELLPPDGTAVVNADAEHSAQVIAAARERGRTVLTAGRGGEVLKLASLSRDGFAQRLLIRHDGESYDIRLPLLGDYQAANALLAAGLAIAAGEPAARVLP